jgi:DNA-binding response OmpR family regulator
MPEEKVKITVAEHDPSIALVLAMLLEDEGYAVTRTSLPDDISGEVRTSPPDVLIMDVLPFDAEKGLDLVRSVCLGQEVRGFPVIVLTSSNAFGGEVSNQCNISRVLVKPFDLADVLEAVRDAMAEPTVLS